MILRELHRRGSNSSCIASTQESTELSFAAMICAVATHNGFLHDDTERSMSPRWIAAAIGLLALIGVFSVLQDSGSQPSADTEAADLESLQSNSRPRVADAEPSSPA